MIWVGVNNEEDLSVIHGNIHNSYCRPEDFSLSKMDPIN